MAYPFGFSYENAVFVSYAWEDEGERTVDELEKAFAAHGIRIVRDKKDLGYKGSIEAFEERIGRGQCIILVISDKYLRSPHCMYELAEIDRNERLRERIFPVVLADARIYEPVGRLGYISHWDEKIKGLNEAMKRVDVMTNLNGFSADLNKYKIIRDSFDHLTDLLRDMNALTPAMHAASGYSTLIGAVKRMMTGKSVANPFSDRGCIKDPARFFDRDRIRREMQQTLCAGNSISLVGDPQVGKSSLLRNLHQTQAEWFAEGRVLFVDLQGIIHERDFCAEVLKQLGQPAGKLRALRDALRGQRVALLLDEVEKLTAPGFTPQLQDVLRALAQDGLTLAVASHKPLTVVFPPSGPTSPFHNIFTEKRLGGFDDPTCRAFLLARLAGTGVSFTDEEIERLVMESGGHPGRLQRLAYDLFERKVG